MTHIFSKDETVRHRRQGPQGRVEEARAEIYTVIARLPVEADGHVEPEELPVEADGQIRYRIRSQADNIERVVPEEQLVRPL